MRECIRDERADINVKKKKKKIVDLVASVYKKVYFG